MTLDGNHGGGSDLELSTVFFALQKKQFPLYSKFNQFKKQFFDLENSLKLADIPAIVSAILDQPIPFSNLGFVHPLFV